MSTSTAKRRRKQAVNGYRHLAKLGRPKLFSVWEINPLRWLGVVRGKDEAQAIANLPQRYQKKLLRMFEVEEGEAGPWKS